MPALVTTLAEAGLPVVLVNPRQLRTLAIAVGELAKTDAIDARVIARFAHDVRPEVRPVAGENQRFFADLAARRRQLVELRTAEHNRRHQAHRAELPIGGELNGTGVTPVPFICPLRMPL